MQELSMKKSGLILLAFLAAQTGTALAGNCPATPPTSRGTGQVAGVPVAGGMRYYFTDALVDGFDCFRRLSGWFPSYIHSANAINPKHEVIDMAYSQDGTATFNNVVVPTSGPYTLTIHYAFATGLYGGVLNRAEGIEVNGTVVTSAMDFPVTGDFETYETASVVANLQAGTNSIELFNLDGASISRADALDVTPAAPGSCITVPATPANVSGLAQSATQVNLSWVSSAAPASCSTSTYDVFRSTNPAFVPSADNEVANGVATTAYDDKTALCNLTYYYSVAAVDAAGASVTSPAFPVTTQACPASSTVQINSGGPAVSSFVADEDFTGGSVVPTTDSIQTVNVPKGLPMGVFEDSRTGTFSYTVQGFKPGSNHTVTLYFIEPTYNGVGLRLFNVSINGTTVLSNFDVFLAAGDMDTPVSHAITAAADGTGQYVIAFTPVLNDAVLSGLQIK
jgi:Malectin domain